MDMEQKEIKLKPRKQKLLNKISNLFKDKNKRGMYVFLFVLPFLIAICIFGFVTFKEAKTLIDLAKGETSKVRDENVIQSMNYVLRNDATEYQKQTFAELKQAIEVDNADDTTIVGLVGKNYVADFYTWTNKQGQFDVGGLYYVCSEKNETTKYKDNIYIKARDGFYKYINEYINEYGSENLIEVQDVQVSKCVKNSNSYVLHEFIESHQEIPGDENSEWIITYDDIEHTCYNVTLNWSYKPETKLDLSKFATSINLLIIENDGRFEIVEASEKEIKVEQIEEINEDGTEATEQQG